MPGKVVIVLEAQDREALARIKEFGRSVDDTVSKLKAANPALEGTRVSVRNLTSAKVDAFKAGQQWQGVLQVLPGQLGAVASQASSVASALTGPGGMVVGLAAVVSGGVLLAKSLANDVERLTNLSRQTGLAVSSLQAFEQAAKEAGESPDTLIQGLGRVNTAINDVLMGTANAGKAFQAIGVDLRTLVKEGASTEQILEATAKALAAIPDPTARAAAQMELFGTRGRAMSTVLDTIAKDGLGAYITAMKQAGIVTSEETNRSALAIDALADRFDRAMAGMVQRAKAGAVEITRAIAEAFGLLPSTPLPIPGSALGDLGPAGERRPPQDRVLAPSAEATRALEEAQKRAEAAASAIAQIFADLDAALASQALGEDLIQRSTEALEREAEAFETVRQRLTDYVASLTIGVDQTTAWIDGTRVHTQAIRENGEELENLGMHVGDVTSQLATFRQMQDESRHATLTLTGELTEQDRAYLQLQAALQATEGSVERLAARVRVELPSAFEQFRTGFEGVTDQLVQAFATWESQGAMTAQNLHAAFAESFFLVMKGDFDDLDDVWKQFFNAVLSQIAAFLASEAVIALLKLVKDLGNFGGGGGFSGGGGGGGSSTTDYINTGINILGFASDVGLFQQPKANLDAASASTRRLSQDTQQLETDVAAVVAGYRELAETLRDVGGAQAGEMGPAPGTPTLGKNITGYSFGAGVKSFGALSILGPGIAVVAALTGGLEVDGKAIRDMVIGGIKDLVDTVFGLVGLETAFGPTNQTRNAILSLAQNEYELGLAAQQAAQITAQTAQAAMNFQGDLDILSGGLSDASRATTQTAEETKGFTGELDILGDAIAEATTAAGDAAAAAISAAAEAEQAAADAKEAADAASDERGGSQVGSADRSDRDAPGDVGFSGSGDAMQHGGFVTHPRRVLIAERFPEAVLGPPSQQAFAREFAAAIAANLGGGDDRDLMLEQNRLLKQMVRALTGAAGRGGPAGAVL